MTPGGAQIVLQVGRLLLVEDNPMDQNYLKRSLRGLGEGLVIRTAPTVGRAAELLETEVFDVAMVDWQLPDGFGSEVLKAALAAEPPVPVVMMTGGDASDAEGMLNQGAQDFVSKRARPPEILRAVRYAVTRSRWDAFTKQTAMLAESRERSAAMSRLAAGVAHDLNNTLAVVSMNLELLSGLVGPLSEDAAECLEAAREAAHAAAERCAQLRTYTGSVEVKSHPVDLAELVASAHPRPIPAWRRECHHPRRQRCAAVTLRPSYRRCGRARRAEHPGPFFRSGGAAGRLSVGVARQQECPARPSPDLRLDRAARGGPRPPAPLRSLRRGRP